MTAWGRGTALPPTHAWPHPPFLRIVSFYPPPSSLSQAHSSLYKVYPVISSIALQFRRFPLPHSGRVKNFLPPTAVSVAASESLHLPRASSLPFLSTAASLPWPLLAQPPSGSLKEKCEELLLFNYKCYCNIYKEEHFKLN